MNCPDCSVEVPVDDNFCEECGMRLSGAPTPSVSPCARCGAGPETVDADGFCSACGVRRGTQERDRIEIVISPDFAGVSDRGLRHHRNEDFLALLLQQPDRRVLVVCDGVSSTTDADRASQAAAESAVRELARGRSAVINMEAAIAAAQKAVAGLSPNKSLGAESPATTIVAAVVTQDGTATIGWLGDSRAYWIGEGEPMQLTRDHSWLGEMVESGVMGEEEALKSSSAHAITRWLGADAPADSPETLGAPVSTVVLSGPGTLLLCTDGLWNYAPHPASIAKLVRSAQGDALAKARSLVDFANAQGGHDNITAVLLTL